MAEEVEKKYRLTTAQRERVVQKLAAVNALYEGEDFEENILFRGGMLTLKQSILRLRKTQDKTILTYKEVLASDSDIKRRLEHETAVADAAALEAILTSLGYTQSLVYEKRRKTWRFEAVEIVVDELPFGWFLEIEGAEEAILAAEIKLELSDLESEPSPYPALAAHHGEHRNAVIESRFPHTN